MFPRNWGVLVTCTWDPAGWKNDANNRIFIIDEAEDVIEGNLLGLNGSGFTGLAALKGKKVFCFTATLTDYWKHCFRKVFGVPPTAIKHFHTAQFYKTGVENKQQIVVSVRGNRTRAIEDLVQDVVDKAVR